MRLRKNKKVFQIKHKDAEVPEPRIWTGIGHLKQSVKVTSPYYKDYQVVEYDVVEVGVINFTDLDTRFPSRKK